MIDAVSTTDHSEAPLRERLTAIGTAFLTLVLAPHVRTITLTLPAAVRDNPALALRFYEAGPGHTRAALAAIIAEAAERGVLATDSPIWAADDLLSLWEGGLLGQLIFGVIEPVSPEEITRRARRGTEVFLRAYAPVPKR
jgi:TetR/AcrR family transcriptional repressor of mexJK operon